MKKSQSELKRTQVKFLTSESLKKAIDDRAWMLRLSAGEYLRSLVEADLRRQSKRLVGRD